MVPTVVLPPATPLTSQVTPVFEVFPRVAVNVCAVPPAWTLSVVGQTATTIVAGVREQAPVPETLPGAVVVAEGGLITTSAVSWRFRSSVTVSRTVPSPQDGAVTVAVAVDPPWTVR